ncbi:MAG TPA: hypothetical protein VMM59_00630 [Thermohalobaculum sp.]|nr:hypothetical protein [Thermohalobaculum sp.]
MPAATLALGFMAVPMVLLHLYQAHSFEIADGKFRAIHLTLRLLVVILGGLERVAPGRIAVRAFLMLLAVLTLVPLGYVVSEYQTLVNDRPFLPAPQDLAVGLVLLVVTLVVAFRSITGFAQKLSHLEWSGDNLGLLMILAAATALAFGLGLPTSAAYVLVALLGAPALAELGVPLLALMLPVAFGLFWPGWQATLIGMALFAAVLAWQIWLQRRMATAQQEGS